MPRKRVADEIERLVTQGRMKHAVKHIHFVGIGGAGMSGIAEILHNLGYRVGLRPADSATTRRLVGWASAVHRPRCAGTSPAPRRWSPPPRSRATTPR
jgi:hypothetical protein